MAVVFDDAHLTRYMARALESSPDHPVLIDRFLDDAVEYDVDALSDGTEHVDRRHPAAHRGGRHPLGRLVLGAAGLAGPAADARRDPRGDAAARAGARRCAASSTSSSRRSAASLYVLEVNPRASRTVPFVSKAIGVPMARAAARLAAGEIARLARASPGARSRRLLHQGAGLPVQEVPGRGHAARPRDEVDRRGHGHLAAVRRRVRQGLRGRRHAPAEGRAGVPDGQPVRQAGGDPDRARARGPRASRCARPKARGGARGGGACRRSASSRSTKGIPTRSTAWRRATSSSSSTRRSGASRTSTRRRSGGRAAPRDPVPDDALGLRGGRRRDPGAPGGSRRRRGAAGIPPRMRRRSGADERRSDRRNGRLVPPDRRFPPAGDPRPRPPLRRRARRVTRSRSPSRFPPARPIAFPSSAPPSLLALAAARALGSRRSPLRAALPVRGTARASRPADSDPSAWPTLLFAGLAAGWTFRFIYDFETRAGSLGRRTRRSIAAGRLGALDAARRSSQARTLWALAARAFGADRQRRRTRRRDGDSREPPLLRRARLGRRRSICCCGARATTIRRRTLSAASRRRAGIAAPRPWRSDSPCCRRSGSPYWRLTGRLSGGAVDPNSLGVMSAIALVLALSVRGGPRRRWAPWAAGLLFASALILSGSRSALVLVAASLVLLPDAARRGALGPRRSRSAWPPRRSSPPRVLIFSGSRGALGGRLIDSLDASRSLASRASGRPILWRAAGRLFREHPIEGGGDGRLHVAVARPAPGAGPPAEASGQPGQRLLPGARGDRSRGSRLHARLRRGARARRGPARRPEAPAAIGASRTGRPSPRSRF